MFFCFAGVIPRFKGIGVGIGIRLHIAHSGLWKAPSGTYFFNGYHPVFPWVSFLFLGMFVGSLNRSTTLNQKRLFVIGISSTVVAEILCRFLIRYVFIARLLSRFLQ
ncbi:MAG: hypothetical protein DRI65_12070 [Chloroflexota bacterium]|nr:MAG: hypothetical protein DRI65_12070 [Chloroflexota bacterium]